MDLNQQPTLQSPTNLRKESVDDDPLSMFLDNDDEEEEEVDNNNNSNNNNNNQLPAPSSSMPPVIPPRPSNLSAANINLNAKKNFPPTSKYNLGSQNNNFDPINPNILHGSPKRRTASQPPLPTKIRTNQSHLTKTPSSLTPKPNRQPSASDTSFNYNNGMINSLNPLTQFLNKCIEKPATTPLSSESFKDCFKLYQSGSYLKCIETAKTLLNPSDVSATHVIKLHSEEWINLNFLKLLSYVKLNLKDEALKIIETIGVIDQHLYRRNNDNDDDDSGSTVPFALRIEIIKLTNGNNKQNLASNNNNKSKKNILNNYQQNAADRLRGILALLDSGRVSVLGENGIRQLKKLGVKENDILNLRLKLYETIISKLLKCEEYGGAHKLLNDVLETSEDDDDISNNKFGLNCKNRLLFVLSAARVYMHMGDITAAERLYNKGKEMGNNDKIASDDVDIIQARLGLNWGLLLFSKSKFEEAIKIFSEVIDRCRNENMKNNNVNGKEWIELMVSCANNLAVCALMGGDPKHAVKVIELTLQHSMYRNVNIQLIRNLNILYSLLYSPKTANSKKKAIIDAAKTFGIDLPTNGVTI